MKNSFLWMFFCLSILCCSQGISQPSVENVSLHQQKASYSFDSELLLSHVKTLSDDSFQGRRTGTEGAQMARDYIIKQLISLDAEPLGENFEQEFRFKSRTSFYDGTNILATIKGTEYPDKFIVLSAHYDHEGVKNGKIYNGADDDASGVAGLLAFAEYFKSNPPNHSVILAFFDAEELGLQGSKYFLENSIIPIEGIEMNINLDMIGRNAKDEIYVVGTSSKSSFEPIVKTNSTINDISILIGHDGSDKKQDWTYSSDHGSFHQKQIPFLYFGVEDHEDYHQPTDDFEKIQPIFFTNVVESIITIFEQLDQ